MLHKHTSKSKGLIVVSRPRANDGNKKEGSETGLPFRNYFARALVRFFANESRHVEIIRTRLHHWSI